MVKFWIDDFEYVKRLGCVEPFGYLFSICGESANYLIDKYELNYPNIFVNCYLDKTIYVGSRTNKLDDKQCGESCCCDEDDIDELYYSLRPTIDRDTINYEYYKNNSWNRKDNRWV